MQTTAIIGFNLAVQTFEEAITRLENWSRDWEHPRYVSFTAAYTVTRGNLDSDMRDALAGSDMLPADGMPLVWLQRHYRKYPHAERVYAPDVMEALCEKTASQDITHYFWGGEAHVTEKLVATLKERFPGIKIAGYYSPPFAPLENEINPGVVERINAANPHIVWVCLGSVKQDKWMSLYRPHLKAPLLMGVGVSFYFLSGSKPQAPLWMQRNGLEWFFRLLSEPRRLAKRYLFYNPIFILLVLREIISEQLQARRNPEHGKH